MSLVFNFLTAVFAMLCLSSFFWFEIQSNIRLHFLPRENGRKPLKVSSPKASSPNASSPKASSPMAPSPRASSMRTSATEGELEMLRITCDTLFRSQLFEVLDRAKKRHG